MKIKWSKTIAYIQICRAGIFGVIIEYGCDKKITQFSEVGGTVLIGGAIGVIVRLR